MRSRSREKPKFWSFHVVRDLKQRRRRRRRCLRSLIPAQQSSFHLSVVKPEPKYAVTSVNHNSPKHCNEPITCNQCKARECAAGKSGLVWFWFSLVEKVARVLLANHRAKQCKTRANANYLRCSIKNRSMSRPTTLKLQKYSVLREVIRLGGLGEMWFGLVQFENNYPLGYL